MSYCRWSEDCDVYVYASVYGGFIIAGEGHFDNRLDTITELKRLRSLGKKVPQEVIERLQDEITDVFQKQFETRNFYNES